MANIGHNLTDLKKDISKAIEEVTEAKLDREDINAKIAEVRARMASRGIPKAAFDMALRYLSWEPEQREGFDVAYALVREAGGLSLPQDLFSRVDAFPEVQAQKAEKLNP